MNVLIATHGRPDLLQRTLESLAAVRLPPQMQRIIIVENGSDAGARQVCASFAQRMPVAYYNHPAPGKSRALQWAIDNLTPEGLIVFFDDDVRLSPGILEAYAAAAEANGPEYFYGGPFGVDYEQQPPSWLSIYLPLSAKGWQPADPQSELQKTRFLGFNYAVFAQTVRAVGGFNPDIGPGALQAGTEGNPTGQETELQNRLLKEGYCPIWVPEAFVWHYVPQSRCGTERALHREYRVSITRALLADASADNTPKLFGLPRWIYRQYVQAWLAVRLASLWPGRPERLFHRRWRLAHVRGQMAGFKQRAN